MEGGPIVLPANLPEVSCRFCLLRLIAITAQATVDGVILNCGLIVQVPRDNVTRDFFGHRDLTATRKLRETFSLRIPP